MTDTKTQPCPTCNGELAAAILRECTPEQIAHLWVHAESIKAQAVAALEGVVRVADRKTVEFDAARAAIARAKGEA